MVWSRVVSVVLWDRRLSERRETMAMSLYNYLKSRCCKKEQRNGVISDIVCLYANGSGPLESRNLMMERRGAGFLEQSPRLGKKG